MFENLKALRKSLGLTQAQFAEGLGLPQTTYAGYEKGNSDPPVTFWLAVAEKYRVSIDYLLDFSDDPHKAKYGGPSELDRKYAALDEHSKKVVDSVILLESARRIADTLMHPDPEKLRTKIIPLFPTAVAAGPGEPDTGLAMEDFMVAEKDEAEFAVRISGDSMEPELHDGEIVRCVKRFPKIGEICVCTVNGEWYVKQFITDGRNIFLRSINRARKDCDLDIWATGQYTGKFYGTVLHRKIPLVEQ